MAYERPAPESKPSKPERKELLARYYGEYRAQAVEDPSCLNRKVPREAFDALLDQIGALLLEQAAALATTPGPVREFLEQNPLPPSLKGMLPDDFRAFSLTLNALKQWVAAEQAATDRYLLGGNARIECRAAADVCIVSGAPLADGVVELHHPVRDGRPPIPVSKDGHDQIEEQVSSPHDDSVGSALRELRRQSNRSWVHLRRGCLDLLNEPVEHSTPSVAASSKAFARNAARVTGMSYQEIISWLDDAGLGA
ncbi:MULTISPECIES: hypothetical protein [unclassified Corallococcus]|uniref:hypothetical protein n=1 Tax=unclassified Corallococcus TaxID=2685029 RepID=UPI001A8EFB6A|nr:MULTISPECIES: hypothetical protein [unclassified Corallococcus]MBN9680799.1 hypothetical protein [Corallococcus sp. NCSPR001]WAS87596.1 hypothetical protein O0N60_11625 [Corallococcus sp. NCRR]